MSNASQVSICPCIIDYITDQETLIKFVIEWAKIFKFVQLHLYVLLNSYIKNKLIGNNCIIPSYSSLPQWFTVWKKKELNICELWWHEIR